MPEQLFETELWLPRPRAEVFEFFSNAHNLETITPPFLKFTLSTPAPIEMRAGTLIDYRLRIRGLPVRWRTLISAWEPPFRFVDEQVRGPYRQWIHTHTFTERDGGTMMCDSVRYIVPGGVLIDRWIVRPDIERIFAFRSEWMLKHFGHSAPEPHEN